MVKSTANTSRPGEASSDRADISITSAPALLARSHSNIGNLLHTSLRIGYELLNCGDVSLPPQLSRPQISVPRCPSKHVFELRPEIGPALVLKSDDPEFGKLQPPS